MVEPSCIVKDNYFNSSFKYSSLDYNFKSIWANINKENISIRAEGVMANFESLQPN